MYLRLNFTCEYESSERVRRFVEIDFAVNFEKDEIAFIQKILSVDLDIRYNPMLLQHHAPQLYRKIMDVAVMEFDQRYKDQRCVYSRNLVWTWDLLETTKMDVDKMISDDDCELLFLKATDLFAGEYTSNEPIIDELTIFSLEYGKRKSLDKFNLESIADIPFDELRKIMCERDSIYIDLLKNEEEFCYDRNENASECDSFFDIYYIDWDQLTLKCYSASLSPINSRFHVGMFDIVRAVQRSLKIINRKFNKNTCKKNIVLV